MQFICTPCVQAADMEPDPKGKQLLHKMCKGGTWCDCQHRVKK